MTVERQGPHIPHDPEDLLLRCLSADRALLERTVDETAWPPSPAPPILMTLATVGPDGYPRTRNVMLSCVDQDGGIYFHTDSRSEKARHIAECPKASLTILSPDRSRQVTVIGDVVPDSPDGERVSFAARSHYLQLLAWLNDRELAEKSTAERHRIWAEFEASSPDLASDPPPETWAGYAVIPREYLFWTADADGPSRRLHYIRQDPDHDNDYDTEDPTWSLEVLPG